MHLLYVCSFCREFRIQSDTLVDGVSTELKTELDTEDLSKAAVGANDLNFELGY